MYKTAEMVTPKHPDKICDQIADAILDEILKQDENARTAIEAMGGHGKLVLMGEVTTSASVDYEKIARRFISKEIIVDINIVEQSPEIARGVDSGGAGDQGIMVGYATNETKTLLPLEYDLARSLAMDLYKKFPYDGKTQVTVNRGEVVAIVASFQNATHEDLKDRVKSWLEELGSKATPKLHINPAGDWQVGGFDSDVGLTGRKIAVDNYGPSIPIGGGSFSGKDATKVDRSGAYMARRIAVDLLKEHQAHEVYVYLAYAIGVAEPVQAQAVIDGKAKPVEGYDLTPKDIINFLNLTKPNFLKTSIFGHHSNIT